MLSQKTTFYKFCDTKIGCKPTLLQHDMKYNNK